MICKLCGSERAENKCKTCHAKYMREYYLRTGKTLKTREELAEDRNLAGKEMNSWTVLGRVESSRTGLVRYKCQCVCGNVKSVLAMHLRSGNSKSCGCQLRKGRRHKLWRGHGEISGNYWDSIKRGAAGGKGRRLPVAFEITMEYAWELFLKQEQKCSLTGLPLVINYSRKTGKPHTASLDRKDPSKGYVEGNVQWLHKDINMMKRIYDEAYFVDMCKLVAAYNSGGSCTVI